MAGTNFNREMITDGPVIVLVEPQLGENIGMVARAMANFGLADLRLVKPRDGWPSEKAKSAASRADHVIDGAKVFETLEEAVSDLKWIYATTARSRDMLKPVCPPDVAAKTLRIRHTQGQRTGILFGRERVGLLNHEVALADEIVTFPVNPAFASLNIAQAVLLMSYEWLKSDIGEGEAQFDMPDATPADRGDLVQLFEHLERALDRVNYFFPPEKRERMVLNLRSIFMCAASYPACLFLRTPCVIAPGAQPVAAGPGAQRTGPQQRRSVPRHGSDRSDTDRLDAPVPSIRPCAFNHYMLWRHRRPAQTDVSCPGGSTIFLDFFLNLPA